MMASVETGASILVVDDETITRELVAIHLRREGFDVREASSGEAALGLIEGEAMGLVLLDMSMAGMSGTDVIRALRERPETATLPIMILTGKENEYPLVASLGIGADDYLTKPIRLDELVARVRARLRGERVAAEQALRESEEFYRTLVEQSADGVLVSDQTGRCFEANPAICRMLGYSRDELLAMSVPSLSAADDPLSPEEIDEHLADTQVGAGLLVERRYRRKDGTSLPAEVSFTQLRDGRLQRNIRNISVRKAAEASLQRATKLLEASQSLARVGGWELDLVTGALFWTEETYRIHETSPAEYMPTVTTAIQFYAPGSIPIITAAVQDAIERGTPFDLGLELITATGRRIWVHNKATVTMEQDQTAKITGVLQDVTERRGLEARLLQAQRLEAVGRLAGGIAHDFNNLLTAMRGFTELVRRNLGPDNENRADLDQVVLAVDRAVELTRHLLAFSRCQVLQPRVIDLGEIVTGVTPMLQRLLGEHIELATHTPPALGRVKIDPSQFEQVIVNLAVNARDAMPDGGKLMIETANVELDAAYAATHAEVTPGSYVALIVSDTGSGMAEVTQAHIFEPFFTTKEQGTGTGMGLATVYGIVKQSGGSIYVYSEPGNGSSFRIYLPRVEDEASPASAPLPTAEAPTGSETILLVEDEPAVRSYAARILSEQGYTVLEAANGTDALALASHPGAIDLLVTDVVMPGLQGNQLAARLGTARPGLRVLYVSGFTENSVVHHGVAGEGITFLQKPFSVETLGRAVRGVLDNQA